MTYTLPRELTGFSDAWQVTGVETWDSGSVRLSIRNTGCAYSSCVWIEPQAAQAEIVQTVIDGYRAGKHVIIRLVTQVRDGDCGLILDRETVGSLDIS